MRSRRTWIVMASLAFALVATQATFGEGHEPWLNIAKDLCKVLGGEQYCDAITMIPGGGGGGPFSPGTGGQTPGPRVPSPNQQQQMLIGEVHMINGGATQAGIRMTFPRPGMVIFESTWNYQPWQGPYHVQNVGSGAQRVLFGYQGNLAGMMDIQYWDHASGEFMFRTQGLTAQGRFYLMQYGAAAGW
ncbi:MAG: hypothetical protein OXN24_02170 [Candidatus Dadabacteria bacterium]|nr:hypothetical protein [Candidatus Dadabacteria bacterium]